MVNFAAAVVGIFALAETAFAGDVVDVDLVELGTLSSNGANIVLGSHRVAVNNSAMYDGATSVMDEDGAQQAPMDQAFGHHPKRMPTHNADLVDYVGRKIGVPQILPDDYEFRENIRARVTDAEYYLKHVVEKQAKYWAARRMCRNQEERCGQWAADGYCDSDPSFMQVHCPPMCELCHELHMDARCQLDLNQKNAWYPGDLNRMFERIVHAPENAQFNTTVLSRPTYAEGDSNETVSHQLGPWVIIIDDFISADEAKTLVRLGGDEGYEISEDVGELLEDGSYGSVRSKERTSTNAWCNDDCQKHNMTKTVTKRIEDLTRIPFNNSEIFQMLRYEPGQFYGVHHDFIDNEEVRQQGPRILTVFMYLNDLEEGGATNFDKLDLAVYPKRGRVLIWPSVLDEDPHAIDERTSHEAQKVIKGIKFGANSWYHLRDYRRAENNGCT